MNIYSIQNVDGDCEGMQVAESPEMALAKYREWTCFEDDEYEGTTAVMGIGLTQVRPSAASPEEILRFPSCAAFTIW